MKKELNWFKRRIALLSLLGHSGVRELGFKLMWRFYNDFSKFKISRINDKYLIHSFYPPFPSRAFDRAIYSMKHPNENLLFAHFSMTNKCKYNCEFCSNSFRRESDEMSFERIKEIIDWLKSKNVFKIAFTGGEPLLRKDLSKIVKSVGDECVSYVYTSGYGFDYSKALELKKAGLFGIAISFDSYKKEEHDLSRGFKGAFDNAVNAVRISKKFGFYTIAQIIIHKKNFNYIENFLKFLKKLDVDEVRVLEIFPCGKGAINDLMLNDDEREFIRKLNIISNKRNDFPKLVSYNFIESEKCFGCMAGYNFLYISANGDVYPCDMLPVSFGNLNKENFDDVWKRMKKVFKKPSCDCLALEGFDDEILDKFEIKGKLPKYYDMLNLINSS